MTNVERQNHHGRDCLDVAHALCCACDCSLGVTRLQRRVRMKQALTGLLLMCVLAISACGSDPASPSAVTSAAAAGTSSSSAATSSVAGRQIEARNSEQVVFSGVAGAGST